MKILVIVPQPQGPFYTPLKELLWEEPSSYLFVMGRIEQHNSGVGPKVPFKTKACHTCRGTTRGAPKGLRGIGTWASGSDPVRERALDPHIQDGFPSKTTNGRGCGSREPQSPTHPSTDRNNEHRRRGHPKFLTPQSRSPQAPLGTRPGQGAVLKQSRRSPIRTHKRVQ